MKIGFDAKRMFNNQTGLGEYARNLVAGMEKTDNELYLFSPKVKINSAHTSKLITSSKPLWRSFFVKKDIQKLKLDVFHGLSNELPLSFKPNESFAKVVSIHDLIFEYYPHEYGSIDRIIYRAKVRHACKVADKVIAISHQTKQDLVNLYQVPEQKIEVVYQSVQSRSELFTNEEKKSCLAELHIKKPFLLHLASIRYRKNQINLLKAFENIKVEFPELQLIFIGKGSGSYYKKLLSLIKQSAFKADVKLIDYVDEQQKRILYQCASAVCYPSLMEGFGLPIIEALNEKALVLTSALGAMKEAGGRHVLYFQPEQIADISEKLQGALNNAALKQELLENVADHLCRFEEKRATKSYIHIYNSI